MWGHPPTGCGCTLCARRIERLPPDRWAGAKCQPEVRGLRDRAGEEPSSGSSATSWRQILGNGRTWHVLLPRWVAKALDVQRKSEVEEPAAAGQGVEERQAEKDPKEPDRQRRHQRQRHQNTGGAGEHHPGGTCSQAERRTKRTRVDPQVQGKSQQRARLVHKEVNEAETSSTRSIEAARQNQRLVEKVKKSAQRVTV